MTEKKKNIKGLIGTLILMMFMIGFMVGFSFNYFIDVNNLQTTLTELDQYLVDIISGGFSDLLAPINSFLGGSN